MKGYVISCGYMGYIEEDGCYHIFETEEAYKEYVREYKDES